MTEKIKVEDNSPIPERGESEIKPEKNSIEQQPKNIFDQKINEFKDKLEDFKRRLNSARYTNEAEAIMKEVAAMAIEARGIMEKAKDSLQSQLEEIKDESLKTQLTEELSDIKLFNNYYSYLYDNGVMTLTPTLWEPDARMETNSDSRYGDYDSLLNKLAHTKEYDEILRAIKERGSSSKSFLFQKSTSYRENRMKGFDIGSLKSEFKDLIDRFPENMKMGVIAQINELVGKFKSTAICACGDTGCWRNKSVGNFTTILGDEIGLEPGKYDFNRDKEKRTIVYTYLDSMVLGDQSSFEENQKKLNEKIRAKEREIELKKEKKEEEMRKQEEKEKEEKKEKSPGFKALLEAAEKISYNDECGGQAVHAFRKHLETIAEYAEKLEALGFEIIVEQKTPDKTYGITEVIIKRGLIKKDIYTAFNDTYRRIDYKDGDTVSKIRNKIETILETAKMFEN